MEKKKLLVTASTFPRWEGDTEPRFVLDLCIHLADQYDITILVPAAPGAKDFETLEGINIRRYHYFPIHKWETLCYPGAIVPRIREKKVRILLVPFLFLSLYIKLLFILKDYDIVHAHWLIPQGIIQSFFKKTYIVTGHGGDVTSLNAGLLKKLKIRCLKKAKNVTVVSKFLKDKVQELTPDINPDIISMGVDITKFGKQFYIPDYYKQGSKKVVLFVGRLAEKKGVTYLIDAMQEVDALLVIVGDGPMRKELEKQAEEFGNKIRFFGAKTHEELKTLYASADIFVAPSITANDGDSEGFGLVMLEAMASGLAVVASNSGGISQLIEDGVNGLLCEEKNSHELAEKINLLLNNDNIYENMIEKSRKTVLEYDYSALAAKYAELL